MKKVLVPIILVLLITIYGLGAYFFSSHIMPNTYVGELNISMIKKDEVESIINDDFTSRTISIKDNVVKDYNPKITDLGVSFDSETFDKDILDTQNPYKWPLQIWPDKSFSEVEYVTVDESVLSNKLSEDGLLTKEGRDEAQNASVVYDSESQTYGLEGEVTGTILNDEFEPALKEALGSLETEFDATSYYETAPQTDFDGQEIVDQLNSILDRKVSIEFGEETVEVPRDTVATFIGVDDEGNVAVDEQTTYYYFYDMSLEYDNTEVETDSRTVTVYNMDPAYEQIAAGLVDGTDEDIVGVTDIEETKEEFQHYANPTSDSYVEVSIGQQLMWVYNKGELVLQTPVVTGNAAEEWDTPTGTYKVLEKKEDKVLNGASVGFEYEVPVDYWVRLTNSGIGIHDIDWLNSGNSWNSRQVYLTDGSHGCINTPDDLMKIVYDNVEVGTPVYVTK